MKKLASLLGAIVCLIVMDKPKAEKPTRTVINNYFIKGTSNGGCGSCGGNCKCGGHH